MSLFSFATMLLAGCIVNVGVRQPICSLSTSMPFHPLILLLLLLSRVNKSHARVFTIQHGIITTVCLDFSTVSKRRQLPPPVLHPRTARSRQPSLSNFSQSGQPLRLSLNIKLIWRKCIVVIDRCRQHSNAISLFNKVMRGHGDIRQTVVLIFY